MEVKAKAKHIRISPKKTRLVVDVVRGMGAKKALDQLSFLNKKASKPVKKLIESCMANAENNYELDKNNLFVKEICVDEGKTLHRFIPRAYGRATPIRKRTSHITVILGEIKDSGKVEPKKREVEAPVKLSDLANQAEEGGKNKKEKTKKETKQKKTEKKAEAKEETKREQKESGSEKEKENK